MISKRDEDGLAVTENQRLKKDSKKKANKEEWKRRVRVARKKNNTCNNCGQEGHFAKKCKNEKVVSEQCVPGVEKFKPIKGL